MLNQSHYPEYLVKNWEPLFPKQGGHHSRFAIKRNMDTHKDWLIAIGGIALVLVVQMLTMAAMGRHAICQCGYLKLWHGVLRSVDTSQHLFDWYSFTHVLHGFIFYFILRVVFPKLSLAYSLLAAFALEGLWEVLENSQYAIEYYRSGAVVTDKFGDTMVTSFTDTIVIFVGFYMAYKLPVWTSIAFVIFIEIMLAAFAQGNLTILFLRMMSELFALLGFGTSNYR